MKTTLLKTISGSCLALTLFLAAPESYAQKPVGKKGDGKIHLRIIEEINGKSIRIDTSYLPEQQASIEAWLQTLGIEMSAPPAPPAPPSPPDAPEAPDAPDAPMPPAQPRHHKHEIVILLDKDKLSQEVQAELEKEMEKLREEMKDLQLPEITDFSKEDFKIQLEGTDWTEKEKQEFERSMEKVRKEMDGLREKMKHMEIEIIEKEGDGNENRKERSANPEGEKEFGYVFSTDGAPATCKRISRSCDSLNGNKMVFILRGEGDDSGPAKMICRTITLEPDRENDTQKNTEDRKIIVLKSRKDSKERTLKKKEESPDTKPVQKKPDNTYELQPEIFNAFPNPGDGKFNLEFSLPSNEAVRIKMMDSTGKLIYDEAVENFNGSYSKQIDIGQEGRGIYLLSITQGEQWMHKKIVVK